jgi:hypothetical protein
VASGQGTEVRLQLCDAYQIREWRSFSSGCALGSCGAALAGIPDRFSVQAAE